MRQSGAETLVTEEPYALIAHVRVCGGAGWVTIGSTRNSSAIEVNRRRRRAKSDGLDVRKLLSMLLRYAHGERQVWQVVKVPSVEAEDHRHLHRDLETLKQERASTITRI